MTLVLPTMSKIVEDMNFPRLAPKITLSFINFFSSRVIKNLIILSFFKYVLIFMHISATSWSPYANQANQQNAHDNE